MYYNLLLENFNDWKVLCGKKSLPTEWLSPPSSDYHQEKVERENKSWNLLLYNFPANTS